MHEYRSISAVLETSLREYLSASKLALEFKKPSDWEGEAGRCLGFASALLLFCVVDTIGSYHKGLPITFPVDGKVRSIAASDFQHFFVLNAPDYYGQSLGHAEIKDLYDRFRNPLAHNAALAIGSAIIVDFADPEIFPSREKRRLVNLPAFHNQSVAAVGRFLRRDIANSSVVARNMKAKVGMHPFDAGHDVVGGGA